jgi:chromosome segregation ATPase
MTMQGTDPAAVAASTAQGWAYALNTVARPAPEHLEAAQEALTALEGADRDAPAVGVRARWSGVRDALSEALTAARVRVDGGRPAGSITIAELRGALDELGALGLGPRPVDVALAQAVRDDGAADRIAELEAELEEAQEELEEFRTQAAEAMAEARKIRDRLDDSERARGHADARTKAAHAGHSAAIAAAREDSRRAGYLWTLAQLGMNAPGFAEMATDELREEATKVAGRTLAEAGQLRHVAQELARAERLLGQDYDGAPLMRPSQDRPVELATLVVRLADWCRQGRSAALARQRELEARLKELAYDEDASAVRTELAAVQEERDMLARARDVQAAELRSLRGQLAEARDVLHVLRAEAGGDVPAKLEAATAQNVELSRRVAELDAELAELKEELAAERDQHNAELDEARAEATPGGLHELDDQ